MSTSRLKRLVDALDEWSVDALLITDEINVRYLSNFTGDSSYLLVRPSDVTILSDGRYETQIAQECPQLKAAIRSPSAMLPQLLASVIGDLGIKRIGFEANQVTVAGLESWQQISPNVEWIATLGCVEQLRMIKDADEIAITRRAVEIAQRAFGSVVPMLRQQWTEIEIAYELEARMRNLGASGVSFAPIVAAGPAGALPHYHPENIELGSSKTLLVDWGACVEGYASDLTRTLHQTSASAQFCRAYEAVLEAQLAAIEAMGPEVQVRDVDAAARQVLRRHGLEEAFVHGLGHGVGLQIHESPRMSSVSDEVLAPGMIVTVEPGVYFEGDFGIRIEDDVLITDSGCELLSNLPKGLDDCRFML